MSPTWYDASIERRTARGALRGDLNADVAIIGGGFTGVAAALTLAERGKSVVVLEAGRIGAGASGRNGGQALGGWSGEAAIARQLGNEGRAFLSRTWHRGNEIIEARCEQYAFDCEYKQGTATAALNARQMAALEDDYRLAQEFGVGDHFELIDREAFKAHCASEAFIGALVDKRSAHCHPLRLLHGEARAAESIGVRIFERTPATEIRHDEPAQVVTPGGIVSAEAVILAGNAYHALERRRLGGYMLPARTYMLATEPLGPGHAEALLPTNLAISDANQVLDYFRRTPDGRLLYGGRCTYSNREIENIEGSLKPRMTRVFPTLADTRIEYAWGGVIGIPLNRAPLIGRLSASVFYAQGYAGHGLCPSHVAAEILADAIDGDFDDLNMFERLNHIRVPMADAIGGPMLALGMSYFRLRDAIGA